MRRKNQDVSVAILLCTVLLSILCLMMSGCSPTSEYDDYVKNIVSNYRQKLKDPDSLKIRGDIGYFEMDTGDKYVFFTAAGNNSFGASVSSVPVYKNGSYYFDYSDDLDEEKEKAKKNRDYSELTALLGVKKIIASFKLVNKMNGGDVVGEKIGEQVCTKCEIISGQTIANAIKCDYSES